MEAKIAKIEGNYLLYINGRSTPVPITELHDNTWSYSVKTRHGWRVLSKKGGLLSKPYDELRYVRTSYIAKRNNKFALLSPIGEILLPCRYEEIDIFNYSSTFLVKRNNKYGLVDCDGQFLLPAIYDSITHAPVPLSEYPQSQYGIAKRDWELNIFDSSNGRIVFSSSEIIDVIQIEQDYVYAYDCDFHITTFTL